MLVTSFRDDSVHPPLWFIVIKLDTDIHCSLRMNCYNLNDPLTFHLAGQILWSNTLIYDQVPFN